MDLKQKINCTVSSCKFNENEKKKCLLDQIVVTPIPDCKTCKSDESMCSTYENIKK